jgi:hypothetical protein
MARPHGSKSKLRRKKIPFFSILTSRPSPFGELNQTSKAIPSIHEGKNRERERKKKKHAKLHVAHAVAVSPQKESGKSNNIVITQTHTTKQLQFT